MRRPQLKRHLTYIQRVERLTGNGAPWIQDERGKMEKNPGTKSGKNRSAYRLFAPFSAPAELCPRGRKSISRVG